MVVGEVEIDEVLGHGGFVRNGPRDAWVKNAKNVKKKLKIQIKYKLNYKNDITSEPRTKEVYTMIFSIYI